MLISTAFLLALASTLYSSSLLFEVAATTGSTTDLASSSSPQWAGMERKLSLIRRAQEEQQRKLIVLERKLNQVLSKIIHLIYAKSGKQELSSNVNMALERWQNRSNKMEQQINKLQLNFEQKGEQERKKLEEMVELLKQLLATDRHHCCRGLQGEGEVTKTQMSDENSGKQLFDHVYVQPAKADCFELDEQQPRNDGVYKFLDPELNELQRDFNERYCAFATDGPAWTVIQRRSDNVDNINNWENFHRNWDEYRTGFGSLSKDFWFGNQFIHRIVYRDDYVLRIELEDRNGTQTWAEYGLFRLDSEIYNYQLVIGELTENSTAPDALTYHNRMDFGVGRQNYEDCAADGWWFDHCSDIKSNLNGHRIIWLSEYSLNASRMLIRPRNVNPSTTTENSYYDQDDY